MGSGTPEFGLPSANGDGTFQEAKFVLENFGYNAGQWRVDRHPRLLADLTGNGRADIVGFGDAGVWTALSNGDGTFQEAKFVLGNFGYDAGQWRVERHPRFLADLRGKGLTDIVGFGDDGVWTALSNGDGTFQDARFVLAGFGYAIGGWGETAIPLMRRPATTGLTGRCEGGDSKRATIPRDRGVGHFGGCRQCGQVDEWPRLYVDVLLSTIPLLLPQ